MQPWASDAATIVFVDRGVIDGQSAVGDKDAVPAVVFDRAVVDGHGIRGGSKEGDANAAVAGDRAVVDGQMPIDAKMPQPSLPVTVLISRVKVL